MPPNDPRPGEMWRDTAQVFQVVLITRRSKNWVECRQFGAHLRPFVERFQYLVGPEGESDARG